MNGKRRADVFSEFIRASAAAAEGRFERNVRIAAIFEKRKAQERGLVIASPPLEKGIDRSAELKIVPGSFMAEHELPRDDDT